MRLITDASRTARLLAFVNVTLQQAPYTAVPDVDDGADWPCGTRGAHGGASADVYLLLWRNHAGGVTSCVAGQPVPPSSASGWRTYTQWYDCGVVEGARPLAPADLEVTTIARARRDASGRWHVAEILASRGVVQPPNAYVRGRRAEALAPLLRVPRPLVH